jgi:hypothetical protein
LGQGSHLPIEKRRKPMHPGKLVAVGSPECTETDSRQRKEDNPAKARGPHKIPRLHLFRSADACKPEGVLEHHLHRLA